MMYLLTEQEHIFITQCLEHRMTNAMLDTALAMLKAMKPVEPVGYVHKAEDYTLSLIRTEGEYAPHAVPLYAKEQQ